MNPINVYPDFMSRFKALDSFSSGSFSAMPTLGSVAAKMIADELSVIYPGLALGNAELKVAVRAGASQGNRHYRFAGLVPLMIERATGLSKRTLRQGEHWLTTDDSVIALELLAVNMPDVETIISYCSAQIIQQYKQALAMFWGATSATGASPLSWLAQALKSGLYSAALNAQRVPPLSQQHVDLAIGVVLASNKQARLRPSGVPADRAYVVTIDTHRQGAPRLFRLPGVAVLERMENNQLTLLAYSMDKGIEVFDSRESFGLSIKSCLDSPLEENAVWSFDEPEDEFFVALAQTLLDKQLEDISALAATARAERWSFVRLDNALTGLTQMFSVFNPRDRQQFDTVAAQLPSWLASAEPADQLVYTSMLADEVARQIETRGHSFLDDIDSLPDYARHQLRTRILSDHPDAGALDLNDVEIHELGIVNLQMAWLSDEVMSLVEMSMIFIGAKPPGFFSVRGRNGVVLPRWLDADYARKLVRELDIGSGYLALLRRLLIDDEPVAKTRQQLFKAQLRNQLPMLALEKKIKHQSGMTIAGFNLMRQLLLKDSLAQTDTLAIRPLEFTPYAGAAVDTVANMFVLGARQKAQGPFVLYSPFSSEVLREFVSWPLLLEAIQQPGALHDQILEWLPSASRRYYVDGGFERPHLESVFLEGYLAFMPRNPAATSERVVVGDHFEFLYNTHTLALMQLADRQSISVAERRWMWFKQSAWTLFNGLTFFVSGPLASAAWLLQLLMILDAGLQARINNDKEAASQSVINLLFTLALTLLDRGLRFKARGMQGLSAKVAIDEPLFTPASEAPKPELKAVTVTARAPGTISSHNREDYSSLDFSWFGSSPQMTANQSVVLSVFETAETLSTATRVDEGPLSGTYTTPGKRWVRIRGAVYRVGRDPDGLVIRHEHNMLLTGPRLRRDSSGNWDFDLRLRLRGGAPKKTVQTLRAEKQNKLRELEQRKKALVEQAQAVRKVMSLAADLLSVADTRRQTLIDRFEAEFEKWHVLQDQLKRVLDEMTELSGSESISKERVDVLADVARFALVLQKNLEDQHKQLKFLALTEEFKQLKLQAYSTLLEGDARPYEELVAGLKVTEQLERRLLKVSDVMLEAMQEIKRMDLTYEYNFKRLLQVVDQDPGWRFWNIAYIRTLLELLVTREYADLTPEELYAVDYFDNSGLAQVVVSQIDLLMDETTSHTAFAWFFNSAMAEYERATLICRELEVMQSAAFRNEYLPSLIMVLDKLKMFAELHLSLAINALEAANEAEGLPTSGVPVSNPALVQSSTTRRKKLFENERRQVLLGTLRNPAASEAEQVIDIVDSLTKLKISSYRKTKAGTWKEVERAAPALPRRTSSRRELSKLKVQAGKQLEQVQVLIHSLKSQSKTAQIPVEIEDAFLRHSLALTNTAQSLKEHLASGNTDAQGTSHSSEANVSGIIAELELNAERLKQEGRSTRIEMIKAQYPTAERIDYLKTQNEITITKTGPRRHLTRGQRKDYLQEYGIKSKDNQVLWYAHFHYATAEAAGQSYTAAHLKTAGQRTMSERALYDKAESGAALIEIYRSKIDLPLANKLFLPI